jgi:hypothetical protein
MESTRLRACRQRRENRMIPPVNARVAQLRDFFEFT